MRWLWKNLPLMVAASTAVAGCDGPPQSVAATEVQQRKEDYATALESYATDEAGVLESEARSRYESAAGSSDAEAEWDRDHARALEAQAKEVVEDAYSQADDARTIGIKLREQKGH